MFRRLVLFGPFLHSIIISAFVVGVEVWESNWRLFVPPHLAEDRDVNVAHELLTNYI